VGPGSNIKWPLQRFNEVAAELLRKTAPAQAPETPRILALVASAGKTTCRGKAGVFPIVSRFQTTN
jgi:hypothetical protein